MTASIARPDLIPYMYDEVVRDRIRTLHREGERERLLRNLRRVRRAQRDEERARSRLRQALLRLT
ncbi:hypothetical protein [Thermostaphylospora chromogena]|uniref:Uncharacterized protein n=1 Tax=Thermostaphylospora chromogena TaxID=35622 RepID=A0A1H1AW37_9ACTN|nr:hypothetical protein [Thermostaphylospora chromogena]SDQ43915.1 hypothetical protein SAMN04489764_0681 [Thermostaphylospora chromogena]